MKLAQNWQRMNQRAIWILFCIGLMQLFAPLNATAQATTARTTTQATTETTTQAASTPPNTDQAAATLLTERVSLVKPDDFPSVWYDHGCPNCGIVLVGEITRKLNHKVARIDKVVFVSQTSTANWYRCGVLTDVCGTKSEFTADFNNKSGSCEGKTSCYVWRFSTDASPATDVIEVTYLPKR